MPRPGSGIVTRTQRASRRETPRTRRPPGRPRRSAARPAGDPGCRAAPVSSGLESRTRGGTGRLPAASGASPRRPDGERLLRVVPLVERLSSGNALVALEPHQHGVERFRHRLAAWVLPNAGFALKQDQLAHPYRETARQRVDPCRVTVLSSAFASAVTSGSRSPTYWGASGWRLSVYLPVSPDASTTIPATGRPSLGVWTCISTSTVGGPASAGGRRSPGSSSAVAAWNSSIAATPAKIIERHRSRRLLRRSPRSPSNIVSPTTTRGLLEERSRHGPHLAEGHHGVHGWGPRRRAAAAFHRRGLQPCADRLAMLHRSFTSHDRLAARRQHHAHRDAASVADPRLLERERPRFPVRAGARGS